MKIRIAAVLLVSWLWVSPAPSWAQEEKPGIQAQLEQLIGQVRAKLQKGERSEAALADEIKQFDALLAAHQDEKTPEVAQVLMMKATLYTEVVDDTAKGIKLLEQLKTEFPETPQGKNAARMIAALEKQANLAVGKTFPDFSEKDLDGQPLSIGKHKGKVVLVDFWATWCGPCVAELPNVLGAYRKYHEEGFEIVGISLDKERDKLTAFIKEKGMAWAQYFDGKGWESKLAQDYGINSIPATFLLDGEGKVIAKNLRGDDLEKAVAKALGK